jgi:hypothetical protein
VKFSRESEVAHGSEVYASNGASDTNKHSNTINQTKGKNEEQKYEQYIL